MDSYLFSRRRADRFAELLDQTPLAGRHHLRPRADDQLDPLLALSRQLGAVEPKVEVDLGFRTGLRAMLLATAERDGIDCGVPTTAENRRLRPRPASTVARSPLLAPGTARRARARCAILVGVAAGTVAVSGISAASENAVPGDALYGMKRSTERAQLALTGSDQGRGQLFLDFARTRLAEAGRMRGDRAAFDAVLDDMDEDTREGFRLLAATAVQRVDPAALEAADMFLDAQHRAVSALLDGSSRTERERIRQSLTLLDSAGRRAEALRAALACGVRPDAAHDRLGPAPATCPTGR